MRLPSTNEVISVPLKSGRSSSFSSNSSIPHCMAVRFSYRFHCSRKTVAHTAVPAHTYGDMTARSPYPKKAYRPTTKVGPATGRGGG